MCLFSALFLSFPYVRIGTRKTAQSSTGVISWEFPLYIGNGSQIKKLVWKAEKKLQIPWWLLIYEDVVLSHQIKQSLIIKCIHFCHSVTEVWTYFQAVSLCPKIWALQQNMQYPRWVTFTLGSSAQNREAGFWLKR